MERTEVPTDNVLDRAGEEALHAALRRFWHPVMWADELTEGPKPATLLDEPIVVVRLGDGVAAFKDLCVHRGTALSLGWVEGDRLVCAYHGWTYNADGICTRIPATHGTNIPRRARLVRYQAQERHGLIWVCLTDEDEPAMPIADFPEFADPTYRSIRIPSYDWACSAARRVENFVDFSHFPWVHEGILGDRSRPEIPDHEVVRDATSLRFRLGVEEPANPLKADVADGTVQREPSTYRLSMPFTVHLDQPLPDGRHFVLYVTSSPITARRTRSFTWNARNYQLDPSDDGPFIEFQQTILEQDRVVVESQRPEELPIDLTQELHIRGVDRVSIDYRRWLAELALGAGR